MLTMLKMEQALRYNEGKVKWGLVHFKSLEPMIRVLMFGAIKYSPDNWKKGLDQREILESTQRHLASLLDGEKNDEESGLSHMGHIMCNAMFYNYFEDVSTRGPARELQVDKSVWAEKQKHNPGR
jgi:hypothetical protein